MSFWGWFRGTMIDVRPTDLDRKWYELMTLCRNEVEFRRGGRHPKLVKYLATQIDQLAGELGFGDDQIEQREFRAVKDGQHVVRLLTR